jgi:hypothetical protein
MWSQINRKYFRSRVSPAFPSYTSIRAGAIEKKSRFIVYTLMKQLFFQFYPFSENKLDLHTGGIGLKQQK